jgi:hypothetical protein
MAYRPSSPRRYSWSLLTHHPKIQFSIHVLIDKSYDKIEWQLRDNAVLHLICWAVTQKLNAYYGRSMTEEDIDHALKLLKAGAVLNADPFIELLEVS